MVAQAAGRVALIVGGAAIAACVTVPGMYLWNRSANKTAHAAGRAKGEAEEKARQEILRQMNNAATAEMLAKYAESQKGFKITLACVTIGVACAATFGPVSNDDVAMIKAYLLGVSEAYIPSFVRIKVDEAVAAPPSINTAYALAAKVGSPENWKLFDELVDLVAQSKQMANEQCRSSFRSEWHLLRSVG
ncbi:hypothetical protein P5706_34230 [Pseudomonas sp. ChxA]|jgi:hypothetical protein|uniref:hypothetical protein n=1 Tax=Pseudomonas TaxID=286 RepID=UPI000997AD0B|nr:MULTISPECIES: hypothetical protein [Pseudomonas]MBF6043031.1 hypothetical protein [Pseudomonas mucoides]MBJ2203741.1 hypothetical protein [Pseudomonas carnis]MBX9407862.1 hypothetical protein [Pseudomonas baetica]MDL2189228.1 hypothetical protein [Pseudomonas sp. ChxA]NMX82503.1 hypothetical protein [Pseudomonas sp. WS 5503]